MQKHSQSLSSMNLKATIVGAGFSGLTMAYYLQKNGYKVTVFEKQSHPAGLLQSPSTDYGVVEHAANGLINSQDLIDICKDIDLDTLYPADSAKKKYLFFNGKITRWPFGFLESLNVVGKIIKFKRNKSSMRPQPNESFKAWGERVFSDTILQRLIEPAFQGVYASHAKDLSATLVTKNLFKGGGKKSDIKRQTVCFSGGMQEFCEKLSSFLIAQGVEMKLSTEVTSLDFNNLNILTCDAKSASKILASSQNTLAQELQTIEYISIAKVSCFVKNEEHSPEGFGCLFPRLEGFKSLGVLFDSSIFPTRYNDHSLHTWILGDELLQSYDSDKQIIGYVRQDIKKLWGKELKIAHTDVKVWNKTLPLYNSKLEGFISKYDLDLPVAENLYLFANYTGDLGLSQILSKAKKIATRINYEQTK